MVVFSICILYAAKKEGERISDFGVEERGNFQLSREYRSLTIDHYYFYNHFDHVNPLRSHNPSSQQEETLMDRLHPIECIYILVRTNSLNHSDGVKTSRY